ncbi:nucleoside 2-deoxyribosyltransferase [Patescibacteria group bacterium]|nr:nucleoside 2-deoxyribosyltransferase [Patescibacteria group bacterium]
MRIFFAGPLTDLRNPDDTKAFYVKLANVARTAGFSYFWAFLNGTDPIKNPNVTPADVYKRDIQELTDSDIMVAYVGEPSTGTGIEIEYAYRHNIPVCLLYENSKKISRMLRGCPAIKHEIPFSDRNDGLRQFEAYLTSLKNTIA